MNILQANYWDSKFKEEGYAYGSTPNNTLVEIIEQLESQGLIPTNTKVLTLAEGEGRNALYLGQRGYQVHAMDFSSAAMEKLQNDVDAIGLSHTITTEVGDLYTYDFQGTAIDGWDMIICIFAVMPDDLKVICAKGVKSSLKAGGHYIQVSYHADNIGRGTGGPQLPDLCVTTDRLRELYGEGMNIIRSKHVERDCNEGKYHNGLASIIEFCAQKL